MIDTRKYEGHTPAPWRGQVDTDGKTEFDEHGSVWKGKDVIALVDDQACDEMFPDADLNLIADAPLLLQEVKRLRKAWETLRSKTEMSCVCFAEYPDKQDINTHELMDLAMKEAKKND